MGNDSLLWIAPLHDFALCMLNVTTYGFWPLATQSSTPRFEVDQLANRSFERNAQLKNRMFHMIRDNEKQKINEDPTFHPGKQEIIPCLALLKKHVAAPLQAHPYVYETREAATAACQSLGYRGLCGKSQVKGAWVWSTLWQMLTVSLENHHFLKHGKSTNSPCDVWIVMVYWCRIWWYLMSFGVSWRVYEICRWGWITNDPKIYHAGVLWRSSFLPADFDVATVATNHTIFFWPMAHG